MNNTPESLLQELDALKQGYMARLPEKLEPLKAAWLELQKTGWDRTGLERLRFAAHSLAGTSGTYGLLDLSQAARSLENYLKPLLKDFPARPGHHLAELAPLVETVLQKAATAAGARPLAGYAPLPATLPPGDNLLSTTPAEPAEPPPKTIWLIQEQSESVPDLNLQLGHFGYDVKIYSSLLSLRGLARPDDNPAALIYDLSQTTNELPYIEAVNRFQNERERPLPALFISNSADLTVRLAAVRAGGIGYFRYPVDFNRLIDRLDNLATFQHSEPYRILIIEDEPELAAFYERTLQRAGMLTSVVTNPLGDLRLQDETDIDLILMDIYMSNCNGLELAAVIRQQEDYVSIPIVFLSAETNLDKQMEAMLTGGDDFLTKPIQTGHLISSVSARAQRSRILRSLMTRDSMTGLLNHTRTKEQLHNEIARATRNQTELSFAMLDLDNFKSINDTYGHATGDKVIKSLARLLQQRLRKSDVVGRYGGEEFAVILPDTSLEGAGRVMNEIREIFGRIRHQHPDGPSFTASFSCGIAAFRANENPEKLSDAADQALYQAKRSGRNRVEVY